MCVKDSFLSILQLHVSTIVMETYQQDKISHLLMKFEVSAHLKGVIIAMCGFLAIVLFFTYFIFPTVICGTNHQALTNENQNFRDPIAELCKQAK